MAHCSLPMNILWSKFAVRSKEMLFLLVLSRKNLGFFVSNANCQGEFLEYFFQLYFNFLGVLEQITPSYVPNYPQKNIHYVMCKVFEFKRISNFS